MRDRAEAEAQHLLFPSLTTMSCQAEARDPPIKDPVSEISDALEDHHPRPISGMHVHAHTQVQGT